MNIITVSQDAFWVELIDSYHRVTMTTTKNDNNNISVNFNEMVIQTFGSQNAQMDINSPTIFYDKAIASLITYIDILIVKHWVLPKLAFNNNKPLEILDVGAGKGRMTNFFLRLPSSCVAIEPYEPFYSVLKERFSYSNFEAYCCTLEEYYKGNNRDFDLIYVSGVTLYMNDAEVSKSMKILASILRPKGFLLIRDWGHERKTTQGTGLINRTPSDMIGFAQKAHLSCVKYRRPYPPFITHKLTKIWPNRFTQFILRVSTLRIFHMVWYWLSLLNLPRGGKECYFVYLMQHTTEKC